jgi:hypothetical protein
MSYLRRVGGGGRKRGGKEALEKKEGEAGLK